MYEFEGSFDSIHHMSDKPVGQVEDWLVTKMGMPTGINALDQVILGVQPQDYIIVAGSTSIGKSSFASGMCLAFDPEEIIVLFTLEMSVHDVRNRFLSALTKLEWHRIMSGHITSKDRRLIDESLNSLGHRNIIVDDGSFLTPGLLKAKLDYIIEKFGKPKAVIIDYVQLMCGDNRDGRQIEMTNVSHALRAISREYDIGLVAVAQLNRGPAARAEDGFRPRLSDLRESGSFEQDATKVILLHRPGYWKREAIKLGHFTYEGVDESETEIIVAKNRHGPTGTVMCTWHPESCTFDDKIEDF